MCQYGIVKFPKKCWKTIEEQQRKKFDKQLKEMQEEFDNELE